MDQDILRAWLSRFVCFPWLLLLLFLLLSLLSSGSNSLPGKKGREIVWFLKSKHSSSCKVMKHDCRMRQACCTLSKLFTVEQIFLQRSFMNRIGLACRLEN